MEFNLQGSLNTAADWVKAIQQLLDESQYFQAYDLSKEALKQFPDNLMVRLLGVLALIHTGALGQAKKLLEPLSDGLISTQIRAKQLLQGIGRHWGDFMSHPGDDEPSHQLLEQLTQLIQEMVKLGAAVHRGASDQSELNHLLGQIHFRIWELKGSEEDLLLGIEYYGEHFRLSKNPLSGLNAALLSRFMGKLDAAEMLAGEVGALLSQATEVEDDPLRRFQCLARRAETHVLLSNLDEAQDLFAAAAAIADLPYPVVVEQLRRLQLMRQQGVDLPGQVTESIRPPTLVIFAGQPLDGAKAAIPCFPAEMEEVVKASIVKKLDELQAEIGYCSASAGSDLLFVEAMLERNAEVHIFLPCGQKDFIESRVAYAGRHWVRRFHNALRLASSVNYSTEERFLGHDSLFRFNNAFIEGTARLRARFLLTEPRLMLVWDPLAEESAGTGAEFMDQWADITTLSLIQLDELREAAGLADELDAFDMDFTDDDAQAGLVVAPERVVKAMLFVDIVGFSKLTEENLPALWRFLEDVRVLIEQHCEAPDLVESWGDALYVVMPAARPMLRFAFYLQRGFAELDAAAYGFPRPLNVRVGLHAGPVYEGVHPFTGKPIVYGSHVSRAARIEPITVPGEIYASQQFVSLLTVEEKAVRHEREMTGESYREWYKCEYVGILALAKGYANQPIYHIETCVEDA